MVGVVDPLSAPRRPLIRANINPDVRHLFPITLTLAPKKMRQM
jgi:hypothetical protein